jgi:hypothetical protein
VQETPFVAADSDEFVTQQMQQFEQRHRVPLGGRDTVDLRTGELVGGGQESR